MANLPLTFEENRGQWDPEVVFKTAFSNGATFFTRHGVTVELGSGKQRASLRWSVEGADPSAIPVGEHVSSGITNYLLGSGPQSWITGSRLFKYIRTKDVKPGLDLVFYGNDRKLEYDLILKPGADAKCLKIRYEGATKLWIDLAGAVVAETAAGKVTQQKPIVWQDTSTGRVQIAASYRKRGEDRIDIELGTYDRSLPVTIDPILSFSTYLGGTVQDTTKGLSIDPAGNIYVCGQTYSLDFPTSVGAYQVANSPSGKAFITKINPTGSAIVYSTFLGGSAYTEADAIAVDASGDAYVTGWTSSSDFPITPGSFSSQISTGPGSSTLFVTKLNDSGSSAVYSTSLGLTSLTSVSQIQVDTSGNAYLAGSTRGFPVTSGAYKTSLLDNPVAGDGFVAKLNSGGSSLLYATYLGGSAYESITGLVVSPSGQAYISGITTSTDFPVTASALQRTSSNNTYNGFLTCLNASGSNLIFSTYYDGNPSALALDASQNVYLAGYASSALATTTGAYSRTLPFGSSSAAFVSKLNSAATARLYSTFLGPGNPYFIDVDSTGSAIVLGTALQGFPLTAGSLPGQNNGLFVSKLASDGSALTYSTIAASSLNSIPSGLVLDGAGNPIFTGTTSSRSLPTTVGAPQATNLTQFGSNGTGFIQKIDLSSSTLCSLTVSQQAIVVPAGGGSGTVNVIVGNGCPWEIPGTISGLTLNKLSGVGSGSFTYTVSANQSGGALVQTIAVGPAPVTFTQASCSYSLSASTIYVPASGGSRMAFISTSPGCPWMISSSAPYIIASGSQIGPGTATITVSANTSGARAYSIYVAGLSLVVNQAAASSLNTAGTKVGVMQPQYSAWALDSNGNGTFDSADRYFPFLALSSDIAVTGDWTGDGHTKVGVYRSGFFALDTNNNGVWDGPSAGDSFIALGGQMGDVPVVGDWNGDGRTKVGVYRHGFWILDTNGNGVFDAGDQYVAYGGNPGEQPVVGDWNGDGKTKIGFLYNGTWTLDYNGSGIFDAGDKVYSFPYVAGDKAIVGDWNGTHTAKIGIYRAGFWILDYNGNGSYDGPSGGDKFYAFGGNPGEVPIVGDWSGSGTTKIGFYLRGFWCQDYNGNGNFDGQAAGQDRFFALGGAANEQPVLGAW